ncbi:mechanosensitive ion channel [bacterium]|nr:mechanosensitive ion channel [bacterium]
MTARRRLACLAAILLLAAAAMAAPPDATPSPPLPVPDLSHSVEELGARLRQIDRSLADPSLVAHLERDSAAAARRTAERWAETEELLQRQLRPSALDSLESSWRAVRSDLDGTAAEIDRRAAERDADLASLTALQASWSRTLEVTRAAGAPAEVVDRVEHALASIEATRTAVAQRRAGLLLFQDAMGRAFQTCDDAQARIDELRASVLQRALERQQPPLWQAGATAWGEAAASRGGLGFMWADVVAYAAVYRGGLAFSGLVIIAMLLALSRVARGVPGRGSAAAPLRTPAASAILLGILLSRPWRPNPPFALQQLILGVVDLAAVVVLRPLLDRRQVPLLYGLGALVLLSLGISLVDLTPRLEQVALCAILAATAALVVRGAATLRPPFATPTRVPRLWAAARALASAFGWVLAGSAVAAALGYLDLAAFVGIGLLQVLFAGVGLLAVRLTLEDLIDIAVARRPLAALHTVARHRAGLVRFVARALDVGAVALWVWILLLHFDALRPVSDGAAALLEARLQIGELDLPLSRVFAFLVVGLVAVIATRLIGAVLEQDVYARMTLPRGVPYALSTLTRYGLLLVGLLLALATLGLDLTRITVLVSALGLGLGFGMQDVMNNFVSGLIVLFERPVQVGDAIEIGDVAGEIRRIGIRSSTVRTAQGAEVIVPNAKIIAERVTNWTLSDHHRRIDLEVSVSAAADAERVIALLTDVARADRRVAAAPPPETLLVKLGEPMADYQMRFWTESRDWVRVRSDIAVAVQRALRAAASGGAAGPA